MYYYLTRKQMRETVKNNSQRFINLLDLKEDAIALFNKSYKVLRQYGITEPKKETDDILLVYDYIDAVFPTRHLATLINNTLGWTDAFSANGCELECDDRILDLIPKDLWREEDTDRCVL